MVLGLLGTSPSLAETVTLGADADTQIRYGTNQDRNYGGHDNLYIRQNDGAPRDYIGYVRFDVSSLPSMWGCALNDLGRRS